MYLAERVTFGIELFLEQYNNRHFSSKLTQKLGVTFNVVGERSIAFRSDTFISWWRLVQTVCNHQYYDQKPVRLKPSSKFDLDVSGVQDYTTSHSLGPSSREYIWVLRTSSTVGRRVNSRNRRIGNILRRLRRLKKFPLLYSSTLEPSK